MHWFIIGLAGLTAMTVCAVLFIRTRSGSILLKVWYTGMVLSSIVFLAAMVLQVNMNIKKENKVHHSIANRLQAGTEEIIIKDISETTSIISTNKAKNINLRNIYHNRKS